MIDRLKNAKTSLMSAVESQIGNLQNVDAKELGEVVDMVKDLEEAIYYCTITKSMEESEKKPSMERHFYTPYEFFYPPKAKDMDYGKPWDRDLDISMGRMYYPNQPRDDEGRYMEDGRRGRRNYGGPGEGSSSNGEGRGGPRYYPDHEPQIEWRDSREGKSGMTRKMYMESKELHKDKAAKMKDLEAYMKELSEDVVEMIHDASPEEKQVLQNKISALASKIGSLPNA